MTCQIIGKVYIYIGPRELFLNEWLVIVKVFWIKVRLCYFYEGLVQSKDTAIVHKLYFTLLLYFKHSQPLSTKSWLEKSSTKIFVEAFGSISWMNLLMNTLSAESWAYTNKGFIEEMHPKASTKNFCWRFFQSAFCS